MNLTPAQIRRALANTCRPIMNRSGAVLKALKNTKSKPGRVDDGGHYIGLDRDNKKIKSDTIRRIAGNDN